jgi:DNA polymerase-3 subunit delta'
MPATPSLPNWGLTGHEWAVNLLSEHAARGSLRHAYLLTGPQGLGRRTLALALAQALNCPQPIAPGQPCQVCHTCQRIRAQAYPDLSVIQAEQVGGSLKIDQVREIQRSLALAPYEGRYRVAIFLRFEEATIQSQNALLKTLEEPNPQVVLVLTALSAENLLPTIVSRCEILRLRPLPVSQVSAALERRWSLPPERAALLAHISEGRPGVALQYHLQPELLEQRQAWLEELALLLPATRVERFPFADKWENDLKKKTRLKEDLRAQLITWLSLWRDVYLIGCQAPVPITNLDWQPQVSYLATALPQARAFAMIRRIGQTLELLNKNVNTRLALEVLLIELPRLSMP